MFKYIRKTILYTSRADSAKKFLNHSSNVYRCKTRRSNNKYWNWTLCHLCIKQDIFKLHGFGFSQNLVHYIYSEHRITAIDICFPVTYSHLDLGHDKTLAEHCLLFSINSHQILYLSILMYNVPSKTCIHVLNIFEHN